ncbi:MAG: hypothetical protein GF398_02015 [Chitinivibrionales bacterium]|nr:hypothetical protein [Chitinivibrionales bacterium]
MRAPPPETVTVVECEPVLMPEMSTSFCNVCTLPPPPLLLTVSQVASSSIDTSDNVPLPLFETMISCPAGTLPPGGALKWSAELSSLISGELLTLPIHRWGTPLFPSSALTAFLSFILIR